MDIQKLRLEQVDRALKSTKVPPRPSAGWIRVIRSALGMTTRQLAARLDVAQSTVVALEKSEADDKITLHTLRRAAEALDCELHYVFVPRRPLTMRVDLQAEHLAMKMAGDVAHTMRLEEQGSSEAFTKRSVKLIKNEMLASSWKKLWEE